MIGITDLERYSSLCLSVEPSATLAMAAAARALTAQGAKVISLALGEPDFDEPELVKNRVSGALLSTRVNAYPPVPGLLAARQVIADDFERLKEFKVTPDQVVITNGAKQALYEVFFVLVGQGGKAIVAEPAWVSYFDQIKSLGGQVVGVDTGERGLLTPEQLRASLHANPDAKFVLVNSPSNPTGDVYSKEEREAIAAVVLEERKRRAALRRDGQAVPDFTVVFDDIYEHIRYDGVSLEMGENEKRLFAEQGAIYVNGLAKAAAMMGHRVGWVIADKDFAAQVAKVQGLITSGVSQIEQHAIIAALQGERPYIRENLEIFRQRRDKFIPLLNTIGGIHAEMPKAAFYSWVDVSGLFGMEIPDQVKKADGTTGVVVLPSGRKAIETAEDVAHYLLQVAHVAVVFEEAFRDKGTTVPSKHIRISYAADTPLLQEAATRMQSAFGQLKGQAIAPHEFTAAAGGIAGAANVRRATR